MRMILELGNPIPGMSQVVVEMLVHYRYYMTLHPGYVHKVHMKHEGISCLRGAGPSCKILAKQAWGPDLDPRHPLKKLSVHLCSPSTGKVEPENVLELTEQPALPNPWAQGWVWDSFSKSKVESDRDTWRGLLPMHIYTGAHTHTHTPLHTNVCSTQGIMFIFELHLYLFAHANTRIKKIINK